MKKLFEEIKELPEFKKDFKKLLKRYKTLHDDIDIFIKGQLKLTHKLGIDNNGVIEISGLGIENPRIYKAKKFACKSLKGSGSMSGIRLIYAYYKEKDIVEFIEIYYKGEKEKEDRQRIKRYYNKKAI